MLWLKTALFCVVVLKVSSFQKVNITKDLIKVFLDEHNGARKIDKVPALTWSNDLSKSAENWISFCSWEHSSGDYGENLFASRPKSSNYTRLAQLSVTKWVAEKKNLNKDWKCSAVCGHYTQVVWKNTKTVGCAIVHCDIVKLQNFIACQYSPPGNYEGETPF